MATETDELEDEDLEDQQKKPLIGKTIPGPPVADSSLAAATGTIGKPIVPQQPAQSKSDTIGKSLDVLPGVGPQTIQSTTPTNAAPEMPAPVAQSDTISGMGPLSSGGQPAAPLTSRPQYHGLNRVLDTIAGATKWGNDIESAGGFGTAGWRQKNADEQAQLEEAAKLRGQEATTEEAKARAGLTGAEAANVGKTVTVQGPNGPVELPVATWEKLQQEQVKQTGANTRNTETVGGREAVADTNAAARTGATRHSIKVMGNSTYEEMSPGEWTQVGPAPARAEEGNYVPVNDADGNTVAWVNPKTKTRVGVDEIPGMEGAIPPKPGPTVAAGKQSAQDSLRYVQTYMDSGQFTGPGDEAMMEQFFNIAKPSSGFRMSQPQINMLMGARSWMDSSEGMAYHAKTGVWFPPDQRQQMADTIKMLAGAKGVPEVNPKERTRGGTSSPSTGGNNAQGATSQSGPPKPEPGMKVQHRTVNGKTEYRQVPIGK
jgi:hypothetical protein